MQKTVYDNKYMKAAIEEARLAAEKGECPIGAVVVSGGKIIGRGHNSREAENNALLHAEIIAIQEACASRNSWRLEGCGIYVTLEPCVMCAGAIINSRIEALYFGASEPNSGAAGSIINVFNINGLNLNRKTEIYAGIMEEECGDLLKEFFEKLRKN